jgi:Transposase IS4
MLFLIWNNREESTAQLNNFGEAYDPACKNAEIRDYLEERYIRLSTPGQQLDLDETLIRAFGRINFKVRIVTKAAQYGTKELCDNR